MVRKCVLFAGTLAALSACSGDEFEADPMSSSGGAGGSSWCDTEQDALLCEDFDRFTDVTAFLQSWSTYSLAGGEFALASEGGVPSPPNALKVSTSLPSGVQTLVSQTLPVFAQPPSRIRLDFSLRVDTAAEVTALAGAAYAGIMMGDDVSDGVVALAISSGPTLSAAFIAPMGAPAPALGTSSAQGAFPTTGQWAGRYALEIEFATVDGSRVGCAQLLAGNLTQLNPCLELPPSLSTPTLVSLALGVYSAGFGDTGTVVLQFDNVVVTAE